MALGINTTTATEFEWRKPILDGIAQTNKAFYAAENPFDFIRAAARASFEAAGRHAHRAPALYILATDRNWYSETTPATTPTYRNYWQAWLYITGAWNPMRDSIAPPSAKSEKAVAKLVKDRINGDKILFYSLTLILPFRGNWSLFEGAEAWGMSASPYSPGMTRLQEYADLSRRQRGMFTEVDDSDPAAATYTALGHIEKLLKAAQENLATPSDFRVHNPRRR